MTNTKKQLMTAIAMLVVAALALGSSTYAWFVANTSVSVESMTFSAQTVDDLQIALTTDAWDGSLNGNQATAGAFKTLITASELDALYTAKNGNLTGAALIPASTINGSTFFKVADGNASWMTNNQGVTIAKAFTQVNNISENSVKAIPLYLKSTTNTSIYLANTTTVAGAAAPAARIALVENANSSKFIWEPSQSHIADYKVTTIGDADGVSTAVSSSTETANITSGLYKNARPTTAILELTKDEPKLVMVYIWLEGCDVDCVSGLSAKDLTVNLKFTSQASQAQ